MEILCSIFLQTPFWGKFGFLSFVIGLIGLGINYALMPKQKSKSPLFSDPKPEISIFGIIGALGLGFSFLCASYWAYLDPKFANASKKTFSQMIQALGGEYGHVLVFGLMGTCFVFIGLQSAYKLIVKNSKK